MIRRDTITEVGDASEAQDIWGAVLADFTITPPVNRSLGEFTIVDFQNRTGMSYTWCRKQLLQRVNSGDYGTRQGQMDNGKLGNIYWKKNMPPVNATLLISTPSGGTKPVRRKRKRAAKKTAAKKNK